MKMIRIFSIVFLFFVFVQGSVFAQDYETMSMEEAEAIEQSRSVSDIGIPGVPMRQVGESPPVEPYIPEVKFLKIEKPLAVSQMVESLLYGVYTDIPPKYDHFGYELRRYMAKVGSTDVLGNEQRIYDEMTNIRKARIVMRYWRDSLSSKISEIEKIIDENENTSSRVRSEFRYNRGIVHGFLADCQKWIDVNYEFLEFLQKKKLNYKYEDPMMIFGDGTDRTEFIALLNKRETARSKINEYVPFARMIY